MVARRRGRIIAVAMSAVSLTGCGTVLGDMGASAQARRDLAVDDSRSSSGGSTQKRAASACARLVDGAVVRSARCIDLENLPVMFAESGSWAWVSDSGPIGAAPASIGKGHWIWVTPEGRVVLPSSNGRWYWVLPSGVAIDDRPRGPAEGAWFWLTSPTQISATPVGGSYRVPIPGGTSPTSGWYYSPTEQLGGPVTGGSGDEPVFTLPADVGDSSRTPSSTSAQRPQQPGQGTSAQPAKGPDAVCPRSEAVAERSNGWIDSGSCKSPFVWSETTRSDLVRGQTALVSGLVTPETASSTPFRVDIEVVRGVGTKPIVSSIRVTPAEQGLAGTGPIEPVTDGRCDGPGVTFEVLEATNPRFEASRDRIVICDAELASALLT